MMQRTFILAAAGVLVFGLTPLGAADPVYAQESLTAIGRDPGLDAVRLVPLEGVQNFRDIGGYRTVDGRQVRTGLIYRSSALAGMTNADREVLHALGVRSVHDLRTTAERAHAPTNWTGETAPVFYTHDYVADSSILAKVLTPDLDAEGARRAFTTLYPVILADQKPHEAALFDDLLKGGTVVFHCTAGKDRTGIATALLLSVLGVPRETIMADFEMSNRYYRHVASVAGAEGRGADPAASPFAHLRPEAKAVFASVDRRYLEAIFTHIEARYGSVEAYLKEELGVDENDLSRLKELYLV